MTTLTYRIDDERITFYNDGYELGAFYVAGLTNVYEDSGSYVKELLTKIANVERENARLLQRLARR